MYRALHVTLAVLQLYVGLGALIYGVALVVAPDGHLVDMPVSMLKSSPFTTFLVPGLILLAVNGIGSTWAGVLSVRRHLWAPWAGMVFGLGLMIWIFVQVSLIGGGIFIQYLYFAFGLGELLLGIAIREQGRAILRGHGPMSQDDQYASQT